MSSNDPSIRRILPQDSQKQQAAQMSTFSFAPTYERPQREMQKNYVFVDEHNRHKRLKVMRACEGCRRRKIKCDAATTNTWPCSACIRLKLHCVRPNGFDGATDGVSYDSSVPADQFQQITMPMQHNQAMTESLDDSFGAVPGFPDGSTGVFPVSYDVGHSQQDLHYTTVPPPNMPDNSYAQANSFPTPPLHQGSRPDSSPDAQSIDSYQQQDLANLLGTLKLNELGTAPYLRNKASFRRGEQPDPVEDDDDFDNLPPMPLGRGKVRIPPELMPDEETVLQYFELFFTHVHPFVPVLYKPHFYHQWRTARETIPPLILEAIFAIGGRLAEEPAMGNQWLALASRHADNFMDVPRLSTLQALLLILKAREGAPKRGYFWRSWMTVVQCVQMAKDLGLDEHYEDHQVGRGCEHNATDCHLRTRIWQTVYVCEVMIGTPQGRHDLAVDMDSVDFAVPPPVPNGSEEEYSVSRNFTYFSRVVRNIGRMSKAYGRLRKRKDWGIDPEFQQLEHSFKSFLSELPADMKISFPADNSPPWLSSCFLGSLHSYYHLTVILFNRPPLSFLDPNANSIEWKKGMVASYEAAKAVCRLQEAIMNQYGLTGLACMQRGFSFPLYAGLSCIVIHLVAIVSPDPDLNTDAREFFTRHMRIVEQVMEVWPMPELQQQVNNVREAFSADVNKPFALKPSFPYGSPQQSSLPSPPNASQGYQQFSGRTGSLDQQLDAHRAPHVHYPAQPITPPISTGPLGSKNESPSMQSLDMISQAGQIQGMPPAMDMGDQNGWNPSRIFEQWNNTFSVTQPTNVNMGHSPESSDLTGLSDVQSVGGSLPPPTTQHISPQMYTTTANFVTPAMWQESVASVYEGGLKRAWDA